MIMSNIVRVSSVQWNLVMENIVVDCVLMEMRGSER